MAWKLKYHPTLSIVELIFFGDSTGKDFVEGAAARIRMGHEKQVSRFVINARDVIAPRTQALDVHGVLSDTYPDNHANPDSSIAVVTARDPDAAKLVEFFESSALNRGWRVRVFDNRESAIEWLQGLD
ncbi:MAG: hypothetical protein QNJ40_09925 [Xanthomonadales bacterium]|nr:hypothetical protein [Xanthomonadales bacterium]